MVDAQFTNVRVCKPFPGFEAQYQDQPLNVPIAFPGTLDPRAGTAGYSPTLMTGYRVPFGSRVVLWLPMCFSGDQIQRYSYRLVWRFHNMADYINPPRGQPRSPYHFARSSPGAPETVLGAEVPRLPLPASWHDVAYEQAEPVTGAGESQLRIEKVTPLLDSLTDFVRPLLPGGSQGTVQQGILDPTSDPGASMPIFVPFWTDAEGDDLIILATRQTIPEEGTWDFTQDTEDRPFSNVYGNDNGERQAPLRDSGIYLQTGTNP